MRWARAAWNKLTQQKVVWFAVVMPGGQIEHFGKTPEEQEVEKD